jgi:hypothetical protein
MLLCAALIFTGVSSAQEDLGWLRGLLPTGEGAGTDKLLRQGELPLLAGQPLFEVTFDAPDAWPTRNSNYGFLRIQDNHFLVNSDLQDFTLVGSGGPVVRNALIDVDTRLISAERSSAYGLMCRSSQNGSGYYFYIGADGSYRISQQSSAGVVDLFRGEPSPHIRQGQNAENHLSVVCFEDYLALYANGALLAQVRGAEIPEGQIGMMAVTQVDGSAVEVIFDNLRVSEVLPAGMQQPPTPPPPPVASGDQALADLLMRASQPVELMSLLQADSFDEPGIWTTLEGESGSRIAVEGGALRIISTIGDGYIYNSQDTLRRTDVVIQVETNQVSPEPDNAFGILCRASPQQTGRGYYLFISGDGFASLVISDGAQYDSVLSWEANSAINQVGRNLLTAVCVGDYFALYANQTLLYEYRDNQYLSGSVGFSALGFPAGSYTEIEFDNFRIWEARAVR